MEGSDGSFCVLGGWSSANASPEAMQWIANVNPKETAQTALWAADIIAAAGYHPRVT